MPGILDIRFHDVLKTIQKLTIFGIGLDQYIDCGGPGGASLIVLAAQPKDITIDYLLRVQLTQLAGEEADIFEEVINSMAIQI